MVPAKRYKGSRTTKRWSSSCDDQTIFGLSLALCVGSAQCDQLLRDGELRAESDAGILDS